MDDDQQNEQHGLVGWILGIAVTVAIAVALLTGVLGGLSGGPAPAGAPAATASPAPAAAAAASAPVTIAGPAKLYFATGKSELPEDADPAIKPIVDALKAEGGAVAVVSGFHDATGDPAQNAELAKQRAFAVRDLLAKSGVDAGRIDLRKPQETTGSGDDREARRVEVIAEKR